MSGYGATGITLIETLLATTLGAVILISLLTLYQLGIAGHAFAEGRSALAEKVFIIDRLFADELHVAGGSVCQSNNSTFNLINRHHAIDWLRPFDKPVQIADDSITVLKTGAPVPLKNHDIDKARLTLSHAAPFDRGELLIVCDNEISVLLQITSTADGKHTFGYRPTARVRPGNCNSPFADDGCGPEGYRFKRGALVAPYRPVSFFVAAKDHRAPALHRKQLVITNTSGGTAIARLLSEELVENVFALRAVAGVTASTDRVRLTSTPDTEKVIFLDIGFIAGVDTHIDTSTPNEPLYLFGNLISLPADAVAANYLFTRHELSVRL